MANDAGAGLRYFEHDGHRLAYSDHGEGDRAFVLIHGQLLSQYMHVPLARTLARRGHRVVTVDLLGHGASDRPTDMSRYSMTQFAEQVEGLLDHLGLDEAIIGGTSLGANVSLEFGAIAAHRARGLMVEMPVLDEGVYGAVMAFTPLLTVLQYARPLVRAMGRAARLVPRAWVPYLGNIVLDTIRQDHSASPAILQGIFLGRIAPHRRLRSKFLMPVLVIGHHQDPIHPYADAASLADELPAGRLVEATSILELRLHPERLTEEIARFLDECWEEHPPAAARERVEQATRRPPGPGSSSRRGSAPGRRPRPRPGSRVSPGGGAAPQRRSTPGR